MPVVTPQFPIMNIRDDVCVPLDPARNKGQFRLHPILDTGLVLVIDSDDPPDYVDIIVHGKNLAYPRLAIVSCDMYRNFQERTIPGYWFAAITAYVDPAAKMPWKLCRGWGKRIKPDNCPFHDRLKAVMTAQPGDRAVAAVTDLLAYLTSSAVPLRLRQAIGMLMTAGRLYGRPAAAFNV